MIAIVTLSVLLAISVLLVVWAGVKGFFREAGAEIKRVWHMFGYVLGRIFKKNKNQDQKS